LSVHEAQSASVPITFPGLRSFETSESDVFFGRDDDTYELLRRLRQNRFVAVVGVSGCGKSSLVRAGVIASLEAGFLCESAEAWRCITMRPGPTPILSLARALAALSGNDDVTGELQEDCVIDVLTTLGRSSFGLVDAVRQAQLASGTRLFLLVDQFEELFTLSGKENLRAGDQAEAFVKMLLGAAADPSVPVYVMLTMRTDFLGKCAVFPELADTISNSIYLLPQMTRDHLGDAIREPVLVSGGKITDRLINRLLNDAEDQVDQLPVLQHALMRLWEIAPSSENGAKALDVEQYEDVSIGTLSQALDRHATAAFESLNTRERAIAECMFREITAVEDEGQVGQAVIRRPALLSQVIRRCRAPAEEVFIIVEKFRQNGRSFVMPPPSVPLTPDKMLDVSHEALLRQWKMLREWAIDDANDREIQSRLSGATRVWLRRQKNPGFLYQGGQLEEADKWWGRHPDEIGEPEKEFLKESKARQDESKVEKLVRDAEARSEAIEQRRATIYLCASIEDQLAAARLTSFLEGQGFKVIGSGTEIGGGTPSVESSRAQISASDVFVYLLTTASATAAWCKADFEHAMALNKRIVPVMIEPVSKTLLDPALLRTAIHVQKGNLHGSTSILLNAIGEDYALIAEHTRLLTRATEWKTRGRTSSHLLLGPDLQQARTWLLNADQNPTVHPTALHREFIRESEKRRRHIVRIATGAGAVAVMLGLITLIWAITAQAKLVKAAATQSEKKHAEEQSLRSNEYFNRAVEISQGRDPRKDALALRELASALNYDRANLKAVEQACTLLLSERGWARPITPVLRYAGETTSTLLSAGFAPGSPTTKIFAVADDGTLVAWSAEGWSEPNTTSLLTSEAAPRNLSNRPNLGAGCSFSDDGEFLLVVINPPPDKPTERRDTSQAPRPPKPPKAELLKWNGETYVSFARDVSVPDGRLPFRTVAWSPDHAMFTITGASPRYNQFETLAYEIEEVTCMRIDPPFRTASVDSNPQIVAVAFSPNGQSVATATVDNVVQWWDRSRENGKTKLLLRTETPLEMNGRISTLVFGPGIDEVSVSGWNQPLKILNANGVLRTVETPSSKDQFMRYTFSLEREGKRLAAATLYGRICIALASQVEDSRRLSEPLSVAGMVGQPRFSSDGEKLLVLSGGMWNNMDSAQVWDISRFWHSAPDGYAGNATPAVAQLPSPIWLADLAEAVSGGGRQDSDYAAKQFPTFKDYIGKAPPVKLTEPYRSVWQRFFTPFPTTADKALVPSQP
jgi:WD40 repeat protein